MQPKTAVYRKEHFNAAHRLYNESWSDEKNNAVFGRCNNPHFHGHNYEVEVKLVGYPHPDTGYVMDMKKLSDLIKAEIIERFDHKNLNLDVAEFRNLIPTAEHIARVIYDILRPMIDPELEMQVRLYETPRNFVDYPDKPM